MECLVLQFKNAPHAVLTHSTTQGAKSSRYHPFSVPVALHPLRPLTRSRPITQSKRPFLTSSLLRTATPG